MADSAYNYKSYKFSRNFKSGAGDNIGDQDVSWSLVVLPDTQHYTDGGATELAAVAAQFDWIVAQKDFLKIKHVIHVGDIVENNIEAEWEIMKAQISKLDGVLPYTLMVGNHDYYPDELTTPLYNNYFLKGDNSENANLVEIVPGSMYEGTHFSFTAPDGRKIMIAGIKWVPNSSERTAWRNLLNSPEHARKTVIVAIHYALSEHPSNTANGEPIGDRSSSNEIAIWDDITSRCANIQMVLCGHTSDGPDVDEDGGPFTSAHLKTQGVGGNYVHDIVFNAQEANNGGDGWLRYYEFLKDGRTVRCKTYSPYLKRFMTTPRHRFDFLLDD